MDYGEIVYNCNNCNCPGCHLDVEMISIEKGEITEIELPISGGFELDDKSFISIADFMKGSTTKFVKMVLKNHFGEIVNVQEALANSPDIEYGVDHILCYFSIDEKLSNLLTTGSYTLYVYIQNVIPFVNDEFPERTVFNEMVTGPEGLEVIIL